MKMSSSRAPSILLMHRRWNNPLLYVESPQKTHRTPSFYAVNNYGNAVNADYLFGPDAAVYI